MKKQILFSIFIVAFLAYYGCKPKAKEPAKYAKTIENLKAAYLGEMTACAKYKAFAEKAKQEGFPQVAILFETASQAENIHGNGHKAVLTEYGFTPDEPKPQFDVKTTRENLEAAIQGETYEVDSMYPKMIAVAEEENADKAKLSLSFAGETEIKHADYYKAAISALDAKNLDTLPKIYWVCPKCGNTYNVPEPEAQCELCMTPKEKFISIKL
jgi:rubrerythrin